MYSLSDLKRTCGVFIAAECSEAVICDNDGFINSSCTCYCPTVVEGDSCEAIATDLSKAGNIFLKIFPENIFESKTFGFISCVQLNSTVESIHV